MKLVKDTKSPIRLLMLATFVTLILWFIPYADWLVYPIRLFVTLIHESSHAIMGALTGASIKGLVVLPNGEGFVLATADNWFSSLMLSSAGYLGTTACGAILLVLIRNQIDSKFILLSGSVLLGIITFLFAFLIPSLNLFELVSAGNVVFTLIVGIGTVGFFLFVAFKCSQGLQDFVVSFLAVQLILNALLDLKTLFILNAPILGSHINTDANNMANITGIPAIVWVVIWIILSVIMVSIALRLYVVSQRTKHELPFDDD